MATVDFSSEKNRGHFEVLKGKEKSTPNSIWKKIILFKGEGEIKSFEYIKN